MAIDKEQINYVAKLARLTFSEEEAEEVAEQLSGIIGYVDKISQLDTDSVEAAEHIAGIKNVFRQDMTGTCLKQEDLEKLAPEFAKGHIVVPKVIE